MGETRIGPLAHQLQRALRHADIAHAVMDAAGAQTRLRNREAGAFLAEQIGHRHAAILIDDLAMATAARMAHHRDRAHQLKPGVSVGTIIMLARLCGSVVGSVTTIAIAKTRPIAFEVNHLCPLIL